MAKWYLRDRGQVCGPFSTDEILEMRDAGKIGEYHEVSADMRTWKAIEDVPALAREPGRSAGRRRPEPPEETTRRPRPAGRAREPEPEYDAPAGPSGGGNRTLLLIIGGVVGLVLVGGGAVVGILALRSKPTNTTEQSVEKAPEGLITFTAQTATKDRDQALNESVALIVCGFKVRSRGGTMSEVPVFGTGTGFAVTANGHIITNRHVVEEVVGYAGSQEQRDAEGKLGSKPEPKVWVFFGQEGRFEIDVPSSNVYTSPDHDLAILKVDRTSPKFFALCKTNDAETPRFDPVFSLGYPATDRAALDVMDPKKREKFILGASVQRYFRTADFQHTKERGGIRKSAILARPDQQFRETYVLTHDARIAHGNSGGPLVTGDGTVVGINTSGIFVKTGAGGVALQEGQCYAQTLPQLRKEIDRQAPGVVWREPSDK